MVAVRKGELTTVPLEEVGGKLRLVEPDDPLIIKARRMGVSFGDEYLKYLKTQWGHARGSADYCAYFFLRDFENLGSGGSIGLIATNTIGQGDTRELGLDFIAHKGGEIYKATNNHPWPGMAA